VCVCVCVCVWVYVCVCAGVWVCVYVCARARACGRVAAGVVSLQVRFPNQLSFHPFSMTISPLEYTVSRQINSPHNKNNNNNKQSVMS
jgi:hypothetical protein